MYKRKKAIKTMQNIKKTIIYTRKKAIKTMHKSKKALKNIHKIKK